MNVASSPRDLLGALCRDNHAMRKGYGRGPLSGLTFVAKDLFDINGARTGFGHPDWLRTHGAARTTARSVKRLLEAGADMVGKAICDELCYSLTGENVHYGTPANTHAPGRIPGGSSCGSAAAVAGGLVDFSLGSDCGGSVRIPASYCGILGLRPTWGRVSLEGAVPFGPSFDVAGWFARDCVVFESVGRVLMRDNGRARRIRRIIIVEDAFKLVDGPVREALAPAIERVSGLADTVERIVLSAEGLRAWYEAFRTLQAAEVWASVGDWITANKPSLGPGVKERLEWAATVTPAMVAAANEMRARIRRRLAEVVRAGDALCLPSSPRVAPLKGTPTDKIEIEYREQAMCLLCISGHTGLPQVSLPLGKQDGLPLGLSLITAPGRDIDLLRLAREVMGSTAEWRKNERHA